MDVLKEEEVLQRECEEAYQNADEEQKGFLSPEDCKVAVVSVHQTLHLYMSYNAFHTSI